MSNLFLTFCLRVLRFPCLALAHLSISDTEPKNIKVESQGRLLKLYLEMRSMSLFQMYVEK